MRNRSGKEGSWRRSLAEYTDRRVLLVLILGFASGLPLLLTFSTLSAWLASVGIRRATIGAFALVGTPYSLKFIWSPLIDRLPPPLPLGRRRGWGISIQIALIAATLGLGACDPRHHLGAMGALAVLVAFLSASQDVVIDAWRVEILPIEYQGPGAGVIQTGYRIAMLVSGAGALIIADHAGWFAAYATMAAQLKRPERAVFNLHPPPYATQLDDAPALDDELRVQAVLGQVQYKAVGSTAVRDVETQYQPLLGLHGHIHESSGIRRLGPRKSMVINPGSDYSTGALNGALITLDRDKAGAQLVRG